MGPEALKALEPDEFRGLVLEELNSVYRLAHHLARSRDEAEELVQETFLRALKSRSTFRTTEHGARPWLFKILHNTYKTRLERRQREPAAASDAVDGFPDRPAPAGMGLEQIDWEQVDEGLKQAVDALPPNYRSVLLMWAVDGLKYREIASIIDAPVGTVMSRLHRARQAILEQLGVPTSKQGGPGLTDGRGLTDRPRTAVDEPVTARGDARPRGTGSA
jgi:RNA polymerase sigma-70 factor (ECF subfamily)